MKKSNLVIFIHGFKASSLGTKGLYLKEIFQDDYVNPSLPVSPKLQFITLDQLVSIFSQFYEQITLIGSSLGGFLSIALLHKYPQLLKIVLINPAVNADVDLKKYLGDNTDFGGTKFVYEDRHLEELKAIKQTLPDDLQSNRVLLLLQSGDEVLDYRHAIETLPKAHTDLMEGGNHGYVNLEDKIPLIKEFISGNQVQPTK